MNNPDVVTINGLHFRPGTMGYELVVRLIKLEEEVERLKRNRCTCMDVIG